jgi:membrane glycosyltransferase
MKGNIKSAGSAELVSSKQFEEAFANKVRQRRWAVTLVTFGITVIGAWLMCDMLGAGGWTMLKVVSASLFCLLFSALAFGFTQAFLGFLVLAEGHEPLKITNTLDPNTPLASTAVVMPVFNENPETVFGNIRVLYESLFEKEELENFEFYILSDSTDPAQAVEEELAWADLCRQTNGFGRIHYRRRKLPVNRKSGNIADFCRRWGHRHRYMVVLDADSIMTGEAVASLVRMMEVNPKAGIIQSMPRLVKAETVFGRIQQFASRLYSPIFAAGLNFWQQGAGNYWGHNAIIRVAPFLASCALPELPGKEPLGGRILSHDFVEAALMRQAGWEVWFAYDLDGSFEGLPPNLSEYVKRDRRWCQGNLQHMWFLLGDRVKFVSRLHLVQGILAYASAPLLVLFVALGAIQSALEHWQHKAAEFPSASAGVLFVLTCSLLFGPKILSLLHLFARGKDVASFGGPLRVVLGVVVETLFSIVIAPIMLWFHTRFVLRNLAGQTVVWHAQTREGGKGPRWGDIFAEYWMLPVAGSIFGVAAYFISPSYFAWVLPLLVGLWLAIPVAQVSGRIKVFQRLFTTPEESRPGKELTARFEFQLREGDQFVHAVLDPFYNAVHVALQREKAKSSLALAAYGLSLADRLFSEGPDSLSAQEKRALLSDGLIMAQLHLLIWKTPAQNLHPRWVSGLESYRTRNGPATRGIGSVFPRLDSAVAA